MQFDDLYFMKQALLEAKTFSHHIMNELGIERLFVPRGVTIH